LNQASARIQLGVFLLLLALLLNLTVRVAAVHGDFVGGRYHLPAADFTNIYAAGALARAGELAAVHDPAQYEAYKTALLGRVPERADWVYPPPALALGGVFSFLPALPAFYTWVLASLAVMALLLRRAGLGWAVVAFTLLSPAGWRCLALGQPAGLLACAAGAGLLLAGRRPALSGLLLALLGVKPQTALLAPLALLAGRYWRACLWFALFGALVCAAPLLWFGVPAWSLYLHGAKGGAQALLLAPFGQSYQLNGISVFWMLRSLGTGAAYAWAGQALAGFAGAVLLWRAWRLYPGEPRALVALALLLSLFLTPYGFSSDLVGYSLALAMLAEARGWRVSLLDGVLWLWPGFIVLGTALTGVEFTPLFVAVASIRAWRACRP
jgi:alpha-1,2-mannosyltransferase